MIRVKNAQKNDIVVMLKDFVGINGYTLSYSNDETGVYRVVLGSRTTKQIETSETFSAYNTFGEKDNKTTLGQTTTVNTTNPPLQLVAALAIRIVQDGPDVIISAQSAGDLDTGRGFDVFIDSLKNSGYQIEFLR